MSEYQPIGTPGSAVDLLYKFVDYLAIEASRADCFEVLRLLDEKLAESQPPRGIAERRARTLYESAIALSYFVECQKSA